MIRYMQEKDINSVVNLGEELHKESPIFNKNVWDREKAMKFAKNIIENPMKCGFLAFDNKELVGMILGFIDTHYFSYDKFLSEYFVYVKKEKRGSSLGIRLINEWLEWGKLYDVNEVWLQYTTNIDLDRTDKFFNKIGFNKIGYTYVRS